MSTYIIPERRASFCSRLLFHWFSPLVSLGSKRLLTAEDVWLVEELDSSAYQTSLLQQQLQNQRQKGTKPSQQLLWALVRTRGGEWLLCSLLKLTGETTAYAQPILLSLLIGYVEDNQGRTMVYPLQITIALLCSLIFRSFVMQYYVNLTCRVGLTRRTAFMGVVLQKSLQLYGTSANSNLGTLANVLSNDAEKMSLGSRLFQNFWFQPVAIVICMSLLISYIGPSALVGLSVMCLLLLFQIHLAKRLTALRRMLLSKSDTRVTVTQGLVSGIRAIKLLTWEYFVLDKLNKKREDELHMLFRYLFINMLNYLILTMTPIIIAALTFTCYVLLGNRLKASTAFTALSLLGMLRGPLFMFPRVLSAMLDGYVGIERAQRLLNTSPCQRQRFVAVAEEKEEQEQEEQEKQEKQEEKNEAKDRGTEERNRKEQKKRNSIGININHESFNWGLVPNIHLGKKKTNTRQKKQEKKSSTVSTTVQEITADLDDHTTTTTTTTAAAEAAATTLTLTNISMELKCGELGLLLGAVGCGKSSLLASLLGECPSTTAANNGECGAAAPRIQGSVAYVPQVSFIFTATVRENILFGKQYNSTLYNKVLDVCALVPDLKLFPAGDATEIGERGINLSGGQKMRVALARALYSEAQIYIFDDPLAAVDANVSRFIWNNAVLTFLKGKTILMTTNAIHYCKDAQQLYFMKKGSIVEQGSFTDIMNTTGSTLKAMIEKETGGNGSSSEDVQVVEMVPQKQEEKDDSDTCNNTTTAATTAANTDNTDNKEQHSARQLSQGKLVLKEKQEQGTIKSRTWCAYFNAIGWGLCGSILFTYLLRESCKIGMEIWMASWADSETRKNKWFNQTAATDNTGNTGNTTTVGSTGMGSTTLGLSTREYMFGYLIWAGVALVASSVRSIGLLYAAVRAARKTFIGMVHAVTKAPMSWFDTTPQGRILNRVSSDTASVDERVPNTLRDTVDATVRIVGTLFLVAWFSPFFCLLLPLIAFFFFHIQRAYRRTTRELKRFDSTSRSPIFSNFTGCLNGMTSIHAFNQCARWTTQHHQASDNNFRFGYLMLTASRWSTIRFEFIGHVLVLAVSLYISLAANTISPGMAGAALMNILAIHRTLQLVVRHGVQLELGMNAVERIESYTTQIPQEEAHPPLDGPSVEQQVAQTNWPTHGSIIFDQFQLSYRPGLPNVLQNLTVSIQGGEKIGICGRTGSGKSTLALALFRMIESSSGTLLIDGLNVRHMNLQTLRSRISIVPQVPTLFEGTLRYNIDPYQKKDDAFIWACLQKTQLKQVATDLGDGLNALVEEGGTNWSVGQRQLICLARALCSGSQILILDECSASVDTETDVLLQEMIRQEFKHSTVLTIAHRLDTIMHCDQILVMEQGRCAEYDPPQVLLGNEESLFYQMFKNSEAE